MTGLAVVLSLTVVGVVVTVLIAATFIVRRKIVTRTKDITISVPSCGIVLLMKTPTNCGDIKVQ